MTMQYELQRNSIIKGNISCFCLACDIILQNSEEAIRHVETSSHCESLSAVPYSDKFKDQYIRKFKTGYFCELCNKLMPTTSYVNLHLCEEHHQQNRGNKLLKHLGRDVIAFDNVLIKERAWHGLIDNACCICVTDFEDEVLHKQNVAHGLSLTQKPVKFGENDVIYRTIDDLSFQCVTCNKLLPSSTMNKHFNDADHLDVYMTCKIRSNENSDGKHSDEKVADTNIKYGDDNGAANEISFNIKLTKYDNNNKDGTETNVLAKYSIDIHLNQLKSEDNLNSGTSAETAGRENIKTTEIKGVVDVKDQYEGYNESSVDDDMPIKNANVQPNNSFESVSSNPNINSDNPSSADDIEIIMTNNKMSHKNNINNNVFCHPCGVELRYNLKFINQHVIGARHKKKFMATQTKQSQVEFVDSIVSVKSDREMEIDAGYLINNKYYITFLNYLLLGKNSGGSLKCLICSITLRLNAEVMIHHIEECFLPKRKHIQVITLIEDEFIREIQTDAFHCGFCHIIVPGWSEMQRHLRSPKHDRLKWESYHDFEFVNSKKCHTNCIVSSQ